MSKNRGTMLPAGFDTTHKILLIEDDPSFAKLVEILLKESDLIRCEVVNKATLASGINELSANNDYAAVLLDMNLPDSRGFETLDMLLAKHPDANVIVLTGFENQEMGIKAVTAGAQDFIIKHHSDGAALAKALRYSIERRNVMSRLEETQRIAKIGNWESIPSTDYFKASYQIYQVFEKPVKSTQVSYAEVTASSHPFQVFKEIEAEARGDKEAQRDIQIKTASGEIRFIYALCKAEQLANGEYRYTGVVQDITERKLAELAKKESQERYENIFRESKDAIYVCNIDGKLIDCNPSTVEMLGHSVDALKEMNSIHYLLFQQDGGTYFLERLIKEKTIRDYEVELTQEGEESRWLLITANISPSNPSVYNSIVRDITERKRHEELVIARDKALEAERVRDELIASISHEMRTPMNAILGNSNLLLQTNLETEQLDYVTFIRQSSEILLGIINNILDIATMANGRINFEQKDFDIYELITSLSNVMKFQFDKKGLKFHQDIDQNIPKLIRGDRLRLNQILYNLVGNAAKFTDKGHVKLEARVLEETDKDILLKFWVKDTGIGMDPTKLDHIFKTFARIQRKDRIYEGTGLGLPITKNLIELQGGKIGVDSEPNVGSTFYFELRFEKGVAAEMDKPDTPKKNWEIDEDRSFRLLLVEDHKMNQIVAKKTLIKKWKNLEVVIAENGQIAIEKLQESSFDIILMDIQMPVMDGYEATTYIRNQMPPEISKTPILAMTAHAHISKDANFQQRGMDDYVIKPFDPEQLFRKIEHYLNQKD